MNLRWYTGNNIRFADVNAGLDYEFRLCGCNSVDVLVWKQPCYSVVHRESLDAVQDDEILDLILEHQEDDGTNYWELDIVETWLMASSLGDALRDMGVL